MGRLQVGIAFVERIAGAKLVELRGDAAVMVATCSCPRVFS